ncbi:MAG: hypothetical protein F6K14_34165 [Symploca sp. SIO2C1]|nr:hypothetical protein [Symploca sp. SIO2C1]
MVALSQPKLSDPDRQRPTECGDPSKLSTKLAKLKPGYEQLNSDDYQWQLDSNLNQLLVLEVVLIVKSDGTGKFESATPSSHNQLAEKIIQELKFEPTESDCKPVDQLYNLTLTIRSQGN